jgi:hypothetical protein
MSASAFAANGPPDRPFLESLSLPRQVADPGLLEQVLRETLAVSDPEVPLSRSEWEALRQVAERHKVVALSLDPIAVQLVTAILVTRFHDVECPAELWQTLARQIAGTLWEDPTSQARLHAIWASLTEAVR